MDSWELSRGATVQPVGNFPLTFGTPAGHMTGMGMCNSPCQLISVASVMSPMTWSFLRIFLFSASSETMSPVVEVITSPP